MRSFAGRLVVFAIRPFPVSLALRWIVTAPLTDSVDPAASVTLLKQYVLLASFAVPLLTARFPVVAEYVNVPPVIPVLALNLAHAATVGTESAVVGEFCVTVPPTVPSFETVVPAVTFPLTLAVLAIDTEPCVEIVLPSRATPAKESGPLLITSAALPWFVEPYAPADDLKLSILPPLVPTDTPLRPMIPTASTFSVPLWYVIV